MRKAWDGVDCYLFWNELWQWIMSAAVWIGKGVMPDLTEVPKVIADVHTRCIVEVVSSSHNCIALKRMRDI